MDLSLPISYNGITLQNSLIRSPAVPAKNILVTAIDFGTIRTDFYLDKRALQDGMDAADVFLAERVITIDAAIYGSSKGNLWDTFNNFMAGMSPTIAFGHDTSRLGFRPLTFYRPTDVVSTWDTATYPNGIPLQIFCRPIAPPTFRVTRDEQGGTDAGGGSITARSVLVARDPRIYLQTSTSATISSSASTVANRGSYPSLPIITFSLSATGHSAMTVAIDGGSVKLDLSSDSTGTFTINYSTRAIADDSGVLRTGLFDDSFAQNFSPIDPQGSTVQGFNLTGISSISLSFTEAWP